MNRPDLKIVLTGLPRAGKTTVVKRTCELLKKQGHRLLGFYTEEIGETGRSGFLLVTFDGIRIPFAHVDLKRGPRVGPYKVDVPAFEAAVLPQFKTARRVTPGGKEPILVLDEIGKMECLSSVFVEQVQWVLESPTCTLMTVTMRGGGLMKKIRNLAGNDLIHVTDANRDMLPIILSKTIGTHCSGAC